MKKNYKVDLILLFVTMLWGINPSIIKIGLRYVEPLTYNILRLIVASIASVTIIIVVKRYRKLDRKDIKKILLVSIGGFFVFQWFYTMGISKTTAGNTAIIMGMLPLIVLSINHIFGIKKASKTEYIGVLISFIGMVIVIIGTGKLGLSYQNVIGCCFILIASSGYGIYTVFSKQLSNIYSNYQITTYAILLSTILMLILTPYNRNYHLHMNSVLVFSLLFSGILGVCVGNFIWIWCIEKTDSNRVAVYNNLTPVFSVLFGAALLKESFTYIQFIGAIVILVGLYISTYRKVLKKNG